jgi:hypothetical protein
MRLWTRIVVFTIWGLGAIAALAQGVRVPVPYNGQLRSDPDVGNVQGIQRYGRPLRTDPDQGEGFSYHVYPVAESPGPNAARMQQAYAAPSPTSPQATTTRTAVQQAAFQEEFTAAQIIKMIADLDTKIAEETDPETKEILQKSQNEYRRRLTALQTGEGAQQLAERAQQAGEIAARSAVAQYFGDGYAPPGTGLYPPSFDWTGGIRNNELIPPPPPGSPAEFALRAAALKKDASGQLALTEIYHQPLIQIKLRVVEVARGDSFNAGTILEYVSMPNGVPTLTSGQTANTMGQNTRAVSRLTLADLATSATAGSGTLVNLTTRHINGLVQLLATEANADVITAPEMVTLNGQNVEFVSGEKLPFQLGQNVIQGNNNNVQQFFYKHVGTMVSVTPRIVNWGFYGEGLGERPLLAKDIKDWPNLVEWLAQGNLTLDDTKHAAAIAAVTLYRGKPAVPFAAQTEILKALNAYARQDLEKIKTDLVAEHIIEDGCAGCKTWSAQDCTIDVSVVVRLSGAGTTIVDAGANISSTTETNVRAVSNVIQLKSGHGVVMAGLIGERETEEVAKVPVLGDIPIVGFAFRNKQTQRLKTEVLIFVEAQVLDPEPVVARAQSAHDFLLGQNYVSGEFLDNPLEYGMYRVGFGSYLPPHSHGERVFWERYGRKIRKQRTHIDDAFE